MASGQLPATTSEMDASTATESLSMAKENKHRMQIAVMSKIPSHLYLQDFQKPVTDSSRII